MIAMRWEDNYAEDTLGSVSTKTMPVDSFTTQMEAFAKARKGAQPLPEPVRRGHRARHPGNQLGHTEIFQVRSQREERAKTGRAAARPTSCAA